MGDNSVLGKPWTDFDNDTLQTVLDIDPAPPAMTDGHRRAIKFVLDERKVGAE
jgi:hypothetical protein